MQPPDFVKKVEPVIVDNNASEPTVTKVKQFYSSNAYLTASILFASPIALGIFHSHNLQQAGDKETKNHALILGILLIIFPFAWVLVVQPKEENLYNILRFFGFINFFYCLIMANIGIRQLKKMNVNIQPKKNLLTQFISPWQWWGILLGAIVAYLMIFLIVYYFMFPNRYASTDNTSPATEATSNVGADTSSFMAIDTSSNINTLFDTSLFNARTDSADRCETKLAASFKKAQQTDDGDSALLFVNKAIAQADVADKIISRILNMENLSTKMTNYMTHYKHVMGLKRDYLSLCRDNLEGDVSEFDSKVDSITKEIENVKLLMKESLSE